MLLTTKAFILREAEYKDNDRIIIMLSEDLGLITAKARGIKRKNSKLRPACQLFIYGEYVLFENKGFYTINEANAIESFPAMRADLDRITLASYFAQASESTMAYDAPTAELLQLLLNCCHVLNAERNTSIMLVKSVFELRLLKLSGLFPELYECIGCGHESSKEFVLSCSQGGIMCPDCAKDITLTDLIKLPVPVLEAMRYIGICEPKKLFSFRLSENYIANLSDASENFLLYQLDRSFPALRFFHSLRNLPTPNLP